MYNAQCRGEALPGLRFNCSTHTLGARTKTNLTKRETKTAASERVQLRPPGQAPAINTRVLWAHPMHIESIKRHNQTYGYTAFHPLLLLQKRPAKSPAIRQKLVKTQSSCQGSGLHYQLRRYQQFSELKDKAGRQPCVSLAAEPLSVELAGLSSDL